MERWRSGSTNSFFGSSRATISEPELDMRRTAPPRRTGRVAGLLAAWHWLAPGHSAMGQPARSVDRELEESWPSWNF
ncbi:MAG TPA: hypothetical protein VMB26_00270 [Candidatus Binataceae bacterium]|nr:hypothetical protein [Candidatus Binataceae bacterium]